MSSNHLSPTELRKLVYSRVLMALVALPALFFLPAWTLAYWEAWAYMAVLFIPMFGVMRYLFKHDPELLERRMRMREKETTQKRVMGLASIYLLIVFTMPGFDHRFHWSQVPVAMVLAADVLVLLGYGIFILVMRENSYASRVIEVTQGQQVISTGPYAQVRHPMYLGTILMYIASPIALGSYWAALPALLIIPILVMRILNEEQVLLRDLKGYLEYTQKVKYRLVPGLW